MIAEGNDGSFRSSADMSTTRPRRDRRCATRPRAPQLLYVEEGSIHITGRPGVE